MKSLEDIREEVGKEKFQMWKLEALENARFLDVKYKDIYVRGYIEATYLAYGVMEELIKDIRGSRD